MNIDDVIKEQRKIIKKHYDKFKKLKSKNEQEHQRINEEITEKQKKFQEKKEARKSTFDSIRNK